jgi:hypothetical protein
MADDEGELSHWDCWTTDGEMKHADCPTPNSMPEKAMERLLEHVRLIYGEQDWSAWSWEAKE